MPNEPPPPAYSISSVDNALRLLLEFRSQELVRVSDAAQLLGVAPSTAHRLLSALQRRGFAVQDDLTKAYRAGPRLNEIGLAVYMGMRDLRGLAEPIMEQLCREIGETVHLVQLLSGTAEVRVIFAVEPDRALRVGPRIGTRMPAHATASGKSLLACLSPERLRQLYPQQRLPIETKTTIDNRLELEEELERVRQRGYAVQISEYEEEICALGAALIGQSGWPRGAISITIPASRFDKTLVPDLAGHLLRAVTELGKRLP